MRPGKTPYLFLLFTCSCFVLASACSTSTPGSTATPTPSGQVPVATSTASPSTQTSCPAAGTPPPPVMPSLAPRSHQKNIYLSWARGTKTIPPTAHLTPLHNNTRSKKTTPTFNPTDL